MAAGPSTQQRGRPPILSGPWAEAPLPHPGTPRTQGLLTALGGLALPTAPWAGAAATPGEGRPSLQLPGPRWLRREPPRPAWPRGGQFSPTAPLASCRPPAVAVAQGLPAPEQAGWLASGSPRLPGLPSGLCGHLTGQCWILGMALTLSGNDAHRCPTLIGAIQAPGHWDGWGRRGPSPGGWWGCLAPGCGPLTPPAVASLPGRAPPPGTLACGGRWGGLPSLRTRSLHSLPGAARAGNVAKAQRPGLPMASPFDLRPGRRAWEPHPAPGPSWPLLGGGVIH